MHVRMHICDCRHACKHAYTFERQYVYAFSYVCMYLNMHVCECESVQVLLFVCVPRARRVKIERQGGGGEGSDRETCHVLLEFVAT